MKFGETELIHRIQDIKLKGKQGEDLFLAYKTTTYWLGGGVYMKDDGYVLGISGQNDDYYSFPQQPELKLYQQVGMLPSPLPKYSVPLIEILLGYSLWIIIVGIAIYTPIYNRIEKRKAQETAQEEENKPVSPFTNM